MSIKDLKFKVGNIKHLRCSKEMSFNQQFIIKWKESFRKSIGVYEKLMDISKLFYEVNYINSFNELLIYDGCKNCSCTSFECKYCHLREFHRHIDDKLKFKENCKVIRKRGLVGNIICFL